MSSGFRRGAEELFSGRSIQDAMREQLPKDYESLIRAHQLLRQRAECPIQSVCA
jgi:hypothetical protein